MAALHGFAPLPGQRAQVALLERMHAASAHHGDERNAVLDLHFAALGARRRSVADLAGESQSVVCDDGRFVLAFDGDLFETAELRERNDAPEPTVPTRSNEELLLRAWREFGLETLTRLNGMFAFAIADRRDASIVLVRDMAGTKPMFWWLGRSGELVFSSCLKSLLAHPSVPRRVDRRSLEMLLVDRYVADPWTMLEEVKQLPPGCALVWRDGRIAIHRWHAWNLKANATDETTAATELDTRLDQAIRSQLIGPGPVGVLLDENLATSTIAAYTARAARASGERIQTFSVRSQHGSDDTSSCAREVAAHLGAEHHELEFDARIFDFDALRELHEHLGQPLGDPTSVTTHHFARRIAQHVNVAFCGDGGAELFGGREAMFRAARARFLTDTTPAPLRRVGSAVLARVAPMVGDVAATTFRRVHEHLELSMHAPLEQLRCSNALWQPRELLDLCAHDSAGLYLRRDVDIAPEDVETLAPEELVMLASAKSSLPGWKLAQSDRLGSAAGLAMRRPLLDRRVVAFALQLPLELKRRGRAGPHLLRAIGRDLLPPNVLERRENTPEAKGFERPNAEFHRELHAFYAPGSEASRLFREPELRRTLAWCEPGERATKPALEQAAATRVWLLASLASWMQSFQVSA